MANADGSAEEVVTPGTEGGDDGIDLDFDEDDEGGDGEGSDKGDKNKDGKGKDLSDEDRLARAERTAKRLRKKLGKDGKPADEAKPSKTSDKSSDLDYGQLAFHNSKSSSVKIEHEEDIDFLKDTIKDTGKSQQSILDSKWFASELKERQESRASTDAIPKGQRRSNQVASDSVEYWIKKGELPPDTAENRKLRQDVVNAKMAKAKSTDVFTKNPIVK